jgi:hypothetical protein
MLSQYLHIISNSLAVLVQNKFFSLDILRMITLKQTVDIVTVVIAATSPFHFVPKKIAVMNDINHHIQG